MSGMGAASKIDSGGWEDRLEAVMKLSLLGICAVLCGSLICGFGASAFKGPELESLPAAVQRTIKNQLHGGKLARVEEALDQGETVYNVEVKKSGRDRSFVVREDGALARVQVYLEELPVALRAAIQQVLGNGALVQIDKFPDEDETTYDIEMTKGDRDRAFTMNEDGTLLTMEVFLEETPAPVQKAIRARVGTGRLGDITKAYEEGEITYEVTMTRHRHPLPFSVNPDGRLVSASVLLEETPAAVQKAIHTKVGDGYIEEIVMFTDEGKTTYEVRFTKGDATDLFEVSKDGKLLNSSDQEEGPAKTRV